MMIQRITEHIDALDCMKNYPKELFYKGDLSLLSRKKVAIVGSRKPNQYAREYTHTISQKLANAGVCIVSGGAIGTDIIAHKAAGFANTIMVAGTGLDKRYPAINKNVIVSIENEGLVLSQFREGTPSQRYHFPLRNELIVALSDVLIVSYADENSGTMRSVEYAKKMGKKIYVLPHRINESLGTNKLLLKKEADAIYDIDMFVKQISGNSCVQSTSSQDPFLVFCNSAPSYEVALKKFPQRLFEAELQGEIVVRNGQVFRV